jgi:hypothetical protein
MEAEDEPHRPTITYQCLHVRMFFTAFLQNTVLLCWFCMPLQGEVQISQVHQDSVAVDCSVADKQHS